MEFNFKNTANAIFILRHPVFSLQKGSQINFLRKVHKKQELSKEMEEEKMGEFVIITKTIRGHMFSSMTLAPKDLTNVSLRERIWHDSQSNRLLCIQDCTWTN